MKEFIQRTRKSFTPGERENEAQIPENLWVKCTSCRELIYQKQLLDNLKVCPKCGHHMRLSAREWLGLCDPATFAEHDADLWPVDALEFSTASDTYADKLSDAQRRTGSADAVISGICQIDGCGVSLSVCDFEFMGASMGSVFGEKVTRAAERAAERGLPLLTINCSGGARMQEGVIALMQMAKITLALTKLTQRRLPHISLMVDPCYGGVSASYASVADIIIAEPGASIGFAGRRVIEPIIRQKLPPEFQTAQFMLEHGMIDIVSPRGELRTLLGKLLRMHAGAVVVPQPPAELKSFARNGVSAPTNAGRSVSG